MSIEPRRRNQAPRTAHGYPPPEPTTPGDAEEQADPAAPGEISRAPLVRITVNLTPPADKALNALATGQGLSKTDTINRALQVAAVLHTIAPDGHLTIARPDGTQFEVYII
nr:hypothetical protein [Micromonospora sp. DSM 115978]